MGLGEINIAVNEMDQVTQENAAMIEQTTAAAESLKTEAVEMSALMGQFRIGNSGDSPSQAPHRRPLKAESDGRSPARPSSRAA